MNNTASAAVAPECCPAADRTAKDATAEFYATRRNGGASPAFPIAFWATVSAASLTVAILLALYWDAVWSKAADL